MAGLMQLLGVQQERPEIYGAMAEPGPVPRWAPSPSARTAAGACWTIGRQAMLRAAPAGIPISLSARRRR